MKGWGWSRGSSPRGRPLRPHQGGSIYTLLLYAHGWTRWLVLIAGLAALCTSYWGWLGRRGYGRSTHVAGRVFFGALNLQVLLGLVLYALSPLVRVGLSDLGAAMAVKELRFFAVEHITGMTIALVFIHVGSMRVRRAPGDRDKDRHAAIWQTLAALAILVSIPWWRPLLRV